MRVLGITCGRKNGNCDLLMQDVFRGIEQVEPDAVCEYVNLQEAEITPCVGCETCMRKKIEGVTDFHCVHGINGDNMYFIEQKMRAADAIIVGSPTYNLMPPGILINFLNKMHSTADYRDLTEGPVQCKIGACYSVAGTDWTGFTPNIMRFITMELIGSYDGVVDAAHFEFETAYRAVLLNPDARNRMEKMGAIVAKAVIHKQKTGENTPYEGSEGVCPYCHTNVVEIRDGEAYCPMCNIKGTFTVEDGKLRIEFPDDEVAKSRFAPQGQDLHMSNIADRHAFAAMNSDEIKSVFKENYGPFIDRYKISVPDVQ